MQSSKIKVQNDNGKFKMLEQWANHFRASNIFTFSYVILIFSF